MKVLLKILCSISLASNFSVLTLSCKKTNFEEKVVAKNNLQLLNKLFINIFVDDPKEVSGQQEDFYLEQIDIVINSRIRSLLNLQSVPDEENLGNLILPKRDEHYIISGLNFDNEDAKSVIIKAKEGQNLLIGESKPIPLQFIVDKSKLIQKIIEAKNLITEENKETTQTQDFKKVIDEAYAVVLDNEANIKLVNQAIEDLNKAIYAFKKSFIDYQELIKTIEIAETLVTLDATKESLQKLILAIDLAKESLAKIKQEEVNIANQSLTKAIKIFSQTNLDVARSKLSQIIAQAEKLVNQDRATPTSRQVLSQEIAKAKTALNEENWLQINVACENLVQAINKFTNTNLEVAKNELNQSILMAQQWVNQDGATPVSHQALTNAISDAIAVLNKDDWLQVQQANKVLKQAVAHFNGVNLEASRAELNQTILMAQQWVNQSTATQASRQALTNAISDAQVALKEENWLEVQVANQVLNQAIKIFNQTNLDVARSKLSQIIAQAEKLVNQDRATPTSRQVLSQEIAKAKTALNEENWLQINVACENLVQAINKFTNTNLEVAKNELNQSILMAQQWVNQDGATPVSHQALTNAISDAIAVLNKDDWLQVQQANKVLKQAVAHFNGVNLEASRAELNQTILMAQQWVNQSTATQASRQALTNAISDAQVALKEENWLEVQVANQVLNQAIKIFNQTNLEFARNALRVKIAEAKRELEKHKNGNPDSIVALTEVIKSAEEELKGTDPIKIKQITTKLDRKIGSFKHINIMLEDAREVLESVIAKANKTLDENKENAKNKKAWLELEKETNSAKQVIKNEFDRNKIKIATDDLNKAMEKFWKIIES